MSVTVADLFAANAEELLQIVELAVNVTTDCDWGANDGNIGLLDQNLLRTLAELLYVTLAEGFALHQGLDLLVQN